jgi:uncharacterized protein (TIGR01777 family)
MRIAVTGSSGLIGSALVAALHQQGHDVVRLVRRRPTAADEIQWDPTHHALDASVLGPIDAAINLAGAGIADRRWTAKYRDTLCDSRIDSTRTLVEAFASLPVPPSVLLSGSAVGYYGDADGVVDETAARGTSFLSDLCAEWESTAATARTFGTRVALLRTGLVVAPHGGAWGRLTPLAKLGLGGPLGSGQQLWSPISLADHVAAMLFLLEHDLEGPINLTGPEPLPQAEVARTMGRVLHRPAFVPAPLFAVRAIIGEFADELGNSQGVVPRRLLDAGFTFQHPTFESAFRAAVAPAEVPAHS